MLFKGITRPTKMAAGDFYFEGDTSIICVCSGRYYGGGFMPVGEAMPDDGVLDMLVVGKVGLPTFARLVGKYAKGRYREVPKYIRHFHGQEITIASPQEIVTVVDGEVMRGNQFIIRLSEKKVNFFYPSYVNYR